MIRVSRNLIYIQQRSGTIQHITRGISHIDTPAGRILFPLPCLGDEGAGMHVREHHGNAFTKQREKGPKTLFVFGWPASRECQLHEHGDAPE